MSETFTLKDSLYNRESLHAMAKAVKDVYPAFDPDLFLNAVYDSTWDNLTLMERMRHIANVLRPLLPVDNRACLEVLKQTAPLIAQYPFHAICFSEFALLFGFSDWDTAIATLEAMTPFGSSEFAVRPFIAHDPGRMMAQMLNWAQSDNEHIRRLASEGCRPRLPWGMALKDFKRDPSPILPILETLKDDPAEYVRRSVANNLNDIAKDHPDVVINLLRQWQTGADNHPNLGWIIQRALRTLIKAGHTEALALLGYGAGVPVTIRSFSLSPERVQMGETLTFYAEIVNQDTEAHNLVIDFVVFYQKANGKTAPKVFKLTKAQLAPGETLTIEKRVAFRPITTRVYYTGDHAIALKINGTESDPVAFHLTV